MDRINELKALLEKATKGPWLVHHAPNKLHANEVAKVRGLYIYGQYGAIPCSDDATLIAAAVNALPALLDCVDAMTSEIGDCDYEGDFCRDCGHAEMCAALSALSREGGGTK